MNEAQSQEFIPPDEAHPEPVEGEVQVSDLDQFVRLLVGWHANRVRRMEHLLTIPDGAELQLEDDAPVVIDGEARKAFLIAVHLCLSEVGVLPFKAVPDEAETAEPATAEVVALGANV